MQQRHGYAPHPAGQAMPPEHTWFRMADGSCAYRTMWYPQTAGWVREGAPVAVEFRATPILGTSAWRLRRSDDGREFVIEPGRDDNAYLIRGGVRYTKHSGSAVTGVGHVYDPFEMWQVTDASGHRSWNPRGYVEAHASFGTISYPVSPEDSEGFGRMPPPWTCAAAPAEGYAPVRVGLVGYPDALLTPDEVAALKQSPSAHGLLESAGVDCAMWSQFTPGIRLGYARRYAQMFLGTSAATVDALLAETDAACASAPVLQAPPAYFAPVSAVATPMLQAPPSYFMPVSPVFAKGGDMTGGKGSGLASLPAHVVDPRAAGQALALAQRQQNRAFLLRGHGRR